MDKKILISFVAIAGTLIAGKVFIPTTDNTLAQEEQQKPIPEYAKWGRMAMEKVKEKYPNADIIDYLHMGREVGEKTSTEKFKLWLRNKDKTEFGVYVSITFDNQTEKVINIHYEETNQ